MTKVSKQKVTIKTIRDDSYDIVFGDDLFDQIAEESDPNRRYAIITDSNVERLYASPLEQALKASGIKCATFSFPAGEQNKNIDTCIEISEEMQKEGYGRDSTILALGGGVVGDMAGLVASLYGRGIPYIQIPTTILAQADASIGGKTAVDTRYGKNLFGTFKQPERVYISTYTLQSLPIEEVRNGLAETIKHGVIRDKEFFEELEGGLTKKVLALRPDTLRYIAEQNCRIKGTVVEQDPNEVGLRRVLNYGHTIGHAIELLSDYSMPHGECVSIGMTIEGEIANLINTGFCSEDVKRQNNLLKSAELPTRVPTSISKEAIIEATLRDKKAKNGQARYCLPKTLGEMCEFDGEYATPVDKEIVERALNKARFP